MKRFSLFPDFRFVFHLQRFLSLGETVVYPFLGKTLKTDLTISFLMSSVSVRFYSFLSFIRFSMNISFAWGFSSLFPEKVLWNLRCLS